MLMKSEEWAKFKASIIQFATIFESEAEKLFFEIDNNHDFSLWVNDCRVHPIFTKKPEFQKVEYDFTNCETEIRTLSFSRYKDAGRMEITLKKKKTDA